MKIEKLDEKWMQTKNLIFHEQGRPKNPNATTRIFTVQSRQSAVMLGTIKWFPHWRQYVFFPVNVILDRTCMRELADFCELKTQEHREKAKA